MGLAGRMAVAEMPGARRGVVVSALGVVQIFGWGSTYYLLAVLGEPIASDTGWPIAWIVAGLSLGLFVSGMAAPAVGDAIRRFGGKRFVAAAFPTLAAGLLILAAAPSLPVFMAGWVVIGLGMSMGLYDASFATLGGIYGREARAAITSLTLWGGFASTLAWPLSAALNEAVGWRWTCVFYAAVHLCICLPLVVGVVPGNTATPARSATPPAPARLTAAERRAFLIMVAIVTIAGTCFTIIAVHLVTLLQGRGLGFADAVTMGAVIGPAQVVARLAEILTRGRYHPLWTLIGAVVLAALGLLLLASGWPVIGIAMVLYGAGNGIFSIAKGALPLVWFGPDRYASIMGRLARPNQIAQAMAPTLGALLLSAGGVDVTLAVLAALGLVNIGLALLLRRGL